MNEMNGLWQFDKIVSFPDSHDNEFNDHFTFSLDGTDVIVRLVALSPVKWQSDDGFYRLKAMINNDNVLVYLNPTQEWIALAKYVDDTFVQDGELQRKLFRKINEQEVAKWNKDILKKDRPEFDYNLSK
ncbi:MAG: hypothetical protein ABI123_08565 [Ginsengibacter sp.]